MGRKDFLKKGEILNYKVMLKNLKKLRTSFENAGAVNKTDTNELKGHVKDGNQGPALLRLRT